MLENSHDGEEIEDVAWSYFNENQYASVGDDKRIMLWDRRQHGAALRVDEAHLQEIMCVDMSPFDPFVLVTGSIDT
jgi:WD40 repeat protein